VHGDDRLGRQLGVRGVRLDLRSVPLGDLAGEDLAIAVGLSCRSVTPLRLYATATGPTTIGMSIALPVAQRLSACGCCSVLSAESEPAKATWFWMKALTPAPEPVPW